MLPNQQQLLHDITNTRNHRSPPHQNQPPSSAKKFGRIALPSRRNRHQPPKKRWTIDDFEIGRQIGAGQNRVYLARHARTKIPLALKVVPRCDIEKPELLRREIEIHTRLVHPNIIRMYGFFWDAEFLYLVLELAPHGDLYGLMQDSPGGRLSERRAARIAASVAKALLHLHKRSIMHRDLKPSQILLGAESNGLKRIKLCDFGLAVVTSAGDRRSSIAGTSDYLAIEIINREPYGRGVDLWALGCLIYEMLVGSPPFYDEDLDRTYTKISRVEYAFPKTGLSISADAKNLVAKLLARDPRKRLALVEVLRHPWILRHN